MQSIEISGMKELQRRFEALPDAIKQAKGNELEAIGGNLLGAVQRRIGGTGRVAGVQAYFVGSGKGYVAVRAMAETDLDGYAAGYITNALENGHAVRQSAPGSKYQSRATVAAVRGKHMYRDTQEQQAQREADAAAKRIEKAVLAALGG